MCLIACVVSGNHSFQKGISKSNAFIITSSWRKSINKQYQLCWRKLIFWCNQWKVNLFRPPEVDVLCFLSSLMRRKLSYSVVNTHNTMLFQTLPFFGVLWIKDSVLVSKLLKGYFNIKPVKPRMMNTWDVSIALKCLFTFFPLSELSIKLLTYKLIALITLTTAARAQIISALDITYMSKFF